MMSRRRIWTRLLAGLGVLLAAVLLAGPRLRLDRFREPIRAELERALGRRLEINGPVRLRLVPSPGISLTSVVIHDAPEFSREPIAYVAELGAGVSALAALRGSVRFHSLRLVRPSVNLVKLPGGGWNYPDLLERAFTPPREERRRTPRIEVRGGRLNFRFSEVKSDFYLTGADVDIEPQSGSGPSVRFRFAGAPSRTDRAAQGFGRLSGNGRYSFLDSGQDHLRFVVRLERSSIPEILTLLQGHGRGLGGFVAARAEVEGRLNDLGVSGELRLADVDERFLLPSRSGEWLLHYRGRLDLLRQRLELDTSPGEQSLPVAVRLRFRDFLSDARWAASVTADELPLDTIPALAGELGLPAPSSFQLRGSLSGGVSLGSGTVMQGGFRLRNLQLWSPAVRALSFEPVRVNIGEKRWELEPVRVTAGDGAEADVSVERDRESGRLQIGLSAAGLSIQEFRSAWREYVRGPPPLVLEPFEGGEWSGDLQFTRMPGAAAEWSGVLTVTDAGLDVSGVAGRIQVESAAGDAAGAELRLAGRAGEEEFEAVFKRLDPPLLSLRVRKARASDLEDLLLPALSWRRGFLARTLRIGRREIPDWLTARRLAGDFEIGVLQAAPVTLRQLQGRFEWSGSEVGVFVDTAQAGDGGLSGRLRADLGSGEVRYAADVVVDGYGWQGGVLDANGRLTTSETGLNLVANATASGLFSMQFPGAGNRAGVDRADGCFELTMRARPPRLELPCVEVGSGEAVFGGKGSLQGFDRLDLQLYRDGVPHNATGRLDPFGIRLEESSGVR